MRDGLRQSMTWLHTWGGLLATWLLFAIFFTGTLSFFRDEITLWMQPELQRIEAAPGTGVDYAIAELQRRAPQAKGWFISLPGPRSPALQVRWSNGKFDPKAVATLDPRTGELLQPRETRGGGFFRNFHFSLQMGVAGEWIAGAAAMLMFVALITGVIVHKRIFKDLFTFRPGKSPGRAWLDAHNVAGVFSLPFFLMITYTGLVSLMYLYMPVGLEMARGKDQVSFFTALSLRPEPTPPRGEPATLTALAPLLQKTQSMWNGAPAGSIQIANPNDAGAIVDIARRRGADGISARTEPQMRYDGVSGALLGRYSAEQAARRTYGVFYGLHVAWFAGPPLRGLLFAMGLAGCVMIASGALLWAAKRRERRAAAASASFGERMVDALNLAGIAGLLLASLGYLWINRLLPALIDQRIRWEITGFFAVWLLSLMHAAISTGRMAAAWREQMWLAAALAALLPVLNAGSGGLPLPQAMFQGRWAVAGIDLAGVAMAPLLVAAGAKIARPRALPARKRERRPAAEGTAA